MLMLAMKIGQTDRLDCDDVGWEESQILKIVGENLRKSSVDVAWGPVRRSGFEMDQSMHELVGAEMAYTPGLNRRLLMLQKEERSSREIV